MIKNTAIEVWSPLIVKLADDHRISRGGSVSMNSITTSAPRSPRASTSQGPHPWSPLRITHLHFPPQTTCRGDAPTGGRVPFSCERGFHDTGPSHQSKLWNRPISRDVRALSEGKVPPLERVVCLFGPGVAGLVWQKNLLSVLSEKSVTNITRLSSDRRDIRA